MKGFTLFELLIAMMLTAVIGAVMFKTWDLVIRSGAKAQGVVEKRERERIVFGIMDNDMASLLLGSEENSRLPLPSRSPIVPDDEFNALMKRDADNSLPRGTTMLLSFAGEATIKPEGSPLGFPVCVEYVLRRGIGSKSSLVRRERDFCGISGDFPWTEAVLMEDLHEAGMQMILPDGSRLDQWTIEDLLAEPVAMRFYWKKNLTDEEEVFFPLFGRREEVGWDEKKF